EAEGMIYVLGHVGWRCLIFEHSLYGIAEATEPAQRIVSNRISVGIEGPLDAQPFRHRCGNLPCRESDDVGHDVPSHPSLTRRRARPAIRHDTRDQRLERISPPTEPLSSLSHRQQFRRLPRGCRAWGSGFDGHDETHPREATTVIAHVSLTYRESRVHHHLPR